MNKDPSKPQVDSGVRKVENDLPDRSGRLTGHTSQPMKGTPAKDATGKGPQSTERGKDPATGK